MIPSLPTYNKSDDRDAINRVMDMFIFHIYGKPYKLSAVVGGNIFEYNGEITSELMDQYYKTHDRSR